MFGIPQCNRKHAIKPCTAEILMESHNSIMVSLPTVSDTQETCRKCHRHVRLNVESFLLDSCSITAAEELSRRRSKNKQHLLIIN